MKKILISLLVVSLFFPLFNQLGAGTDKKCTHEEKIEKRHQKKEKRHEKRLEKLSKKLELTEEQKEQLSQILKDGWERIKEERRKMMEIVRTIRQETDGQIQKILTPEQLEKFKKYKKKIGSKKGKHYPKKGK